MPDTAAEFRAWEDAMGFSSVADTAAILGVTRQAVSAMRNGKRGFSPPMHRLMEVLLWCKKRGEMPPVQDSPRCGP